ncbi:MAG: GNAT family N-acetyltransferase, partial [Deltaproteobacteria bacterium]|nr:GNAT family N-acetyltransferase [Deltaproteobacteria bacterium]
MHTERLDLVRITPAHLPDLLALDSDPEVMRYISGGKPSTPEDYERFIPRMTAFGDQPYGYLAAYEQQRFIGWFHLRPSVADPEVLELGYRLERAAWGRGLATEGGKALIRHTFETLDRTAVDDCADPRNDASIRVMVKCGMRW